MKQKWEVVEEILYEVGGVDIDDAKQVYHMAICDLCEQTMAIMLQDGQPSVKILDDLRIYTMETQKAALDTVHAQIIKEQLVKYKSLGGHIN